eukprot:226961_1
MATKMTFEFTKISRTRFINFCFIVLECLLSSATAITFTRKWFNSTIHRGTFIILLSMFNLITFLIQTFYHIYISNTKHNKVYEDEVEIESVDGGDREQEALIKTEVVYEINDEDDININNNNDKQQSDYNSAYGDGGIPTKIIGETDNTDPSEQEIKEYDITDDDITFNEFIGISTLSDIMFDLLQG